MFSGIIIRNFTDSRFVISVTNFLLLHQKNVIMKQTTTSAITMIITPTVTSLELEVRSVAGVVLPAGSLAEIKLPVVMEVVAVVKVLVELGNTFIVVVVVVVFVVVAVVYIGS